MIYDLRIYEAVPGKDEAMRERFKNHVAPRLAGHGIELVAVFAPAGEGDGRLHYVTRFADEAARQAGWASFKEDEEWKAIKAQSEKDGPLVASQSVAVLESYVSGLVLG